MIELRDLTKTYGDFTALDRMSAIVQPGEILGLVGPNGAGKTTTLRCIAGIIPPTSGSVFICGHDLARQPVAAKRELAFVPDEPRLFEYLTVSDLMTVVARLYSVTDGRGRSEQLLSEFGLLDRAHAFPSELSRGMKQKLMFAAALLHRPRALVLDEPLTGLDPAAMRRMKRVIVETASQGAAVIVSSHMLTLVEEICSRILILHLGKKILEGTLDEIRESLPEIDRTAGLEEIFMRATGADDAP